MIFGGSDVSFSRISTMIIGWNMLHRTVNVGGGEKCTDRS